MSGQQSPCPAAGVWSRRSSVLVAYGDEHRSLKEAVASAISQCRPDFRVTVSRPGELGTEVTRLDPVLVIYGGGSGLVRQDGNRTWFELPPDPNVPATIRVGGRGQTTRINPGLQDLLSVLDEAERLVREK